jgi:hypothetical protein
MTPKEISDLRRSVERTLSYSIPSSSLEFLRPLTRKECEDSIALFRENFSSLPVNNLKKDTNENDKH